MKKRICFIVNPISGIGKQKIIEKLVEQTLNKSLFDYEIVYTKAAKHATELAQQAVQNRFDIVVAVGGDGSVNETARGLVGTSASLAVIPAGSGNGLARHMKIPLNLKKAMEVINSGKEVSIDTMLLNNEIFINVAGVGFDAHIGREFAKYGKRGFSSYLKVIQREYPKYRAQDYELIVNGETLYKKAFLISFANGSQWGNNAHIAPLADNRDGFIDIVVLKDVSFFNSLTIGYRLFRKTVHQSPYLEIIKSREAIIKQKNTIAHIDGEPIDIGNQITIRVNPLSLKVIVP